MSWLKNLKDLMGQTQMNRKVPLPYLVNLNADNVALQGYGRVRKNKIFFNRSLAKTNEFSGIAVLANTIQMVDIEKKKSIKKRSER